jgi:hypothetical protein
VRLREEGFFKMRPPKVGFLQICPAKIGPLQVRPAEIGPLQMYTPVSERALKTRFAEVRPFY